ncbi:MAG: PDZ domain-containing protein [Candidatus Melainabacteria bacterium]|nr:PDZ domain-containing protein [Candidatus Melainabacteria bacterium]
MNTPRKVVLGLLVLLVGAFALTGPLTGGRGVSQYLNFGTHSAPAQFDGKYLYNAAFVRIRDVAKPLINPADRAKWVAEWEHKFDTDGTLSTEEGTDRAITMMLNSLNQRFDHYSPPQRLQAEQQMQDASLVGIGASIESPGVGPKLKLLPKDATEAQIKEAFRVSDDSPMIVESLMEGSPALKAGVKPGDRFVAVDGVSVNGLLTDEVIKSVKGQAGSQVVITFARKKADGSVENIDLTITRARVIVPVVTFKDVGNGIAYVKLSNFVSDYTVSEMAAALTKAKGMKGLIIDLRGNGGGNLAYLEAIAQQVLADGTMLVLEHRYGDNILEQRQVIQPRILLETQVRSDKPDDVSYDVKERQHSLIVPAGMPIVVLVNSGTASASELLSGLLQANHRATIVGTVTVGKGVGQAVIPLPYGRGISITTFEFLPGGVRMDYIGVVPDVEVNNDDDPKVDEQLEAGKTEIQKQIDALAAAEKRRAEIKAKNDELWGKYIKERNANP